MWWVMSIKNFRERSPQLIGILSILAITLGTVFAFSIDKIPQVKQAYDVQAQFADAAGLKIDNQVRVAGIKVGVVSDVQLAGDRVIVSMEIDNGIEVPADATAEIKLATLLGTKFVELVGRGTSELLEEGDVIPLERTKVPYEIYQAANQGTAVLEGLDGGLLNDLLVELTVLTEEAQDEVGIALEGLNALGTDLSERDEDLAALLQGADDLTGLLSEQGDNLIGLIESSNEVLSSLASQREELQSLLEVTKSMAKDLADLVKDHHGELDSIFRRLHKALVVLDKNVEHLDVAFQYAGDSSKYFGQILQQGRWADIFTCVTVVTAGCEQDE